MKSSKGKDTVAGGSGTPVSRPAPRVGNGLRRGVPVTMKAAARPTVAPAPTPTPAAGGRAKERLRLRLNELLAAEFAAFAKLSPMRQRLAARLGETPEDIGRLLGGPSLPAEATAPSVATALPEAAEPDVAAAPPAAKQPRRAARGGKTAAPSRKAAAPAPDPAGASAFLTPGTTIAIGATMVGAGIAALASVDVNPVAQVETV